MTKKFKNAQLVAMRQSLEPLLKHTGIVGYVAARNARTIDTALYEYYDARNQLVAKYGVEEDGEIKLSIISPAFAEFSQEFAPIQDVEQELEIITINSEQAISSNLLGEEMLAVNWMLED